MKPKAELTFETMCVDAIEQGHRRNVEYLEAMNRASSQTIWIFVPLVFIFASVLTAVFMLS